MSAREHFGLMQKLAQIGAQVHLPGAQVAELIQPFIDRWKPPQVLRKVETSGAARQTPDFPKSDLLPGAIAAIGHELRQRRVRGLAFHRGFQQALADLASQFGYRGWMECRASYGTGAAEQRDGRIDVVWAQRGSAAVLFEIDREVKAASFWKLKEADAPYKFWIYFGRDFWALERFVRKHDREHEVRVVKIRHRFVPQFADGEPT